MADELRTATTRVEPRRLWFGFAGPVSSWVLLGCLDIFITWKACTHQEDFGVPSSDQSATVLYAILTLLLFLVVAAAGVISYRNWRSLSSRRNIIEADAVERREFMALLGVIMSVTLGFSICWFALPPLLLNLCWRAR
jgi:hypothetical protein